MSVPSSYFTSPQGIQRTFGALGQVANQNGQGSIGQGLGSAGQAAGVLGGIQQGGVKGYLSSAGNAGKLAGSYLNSSGINQGAGDLLGGLGIYSGIKQGGVSGDASAAINAAKLATSNGLLGGAGGALGQGASFAAIPLNLYNEINNWQSGATGSDALAGAETGAAIGSVVPVVGTALGALIGGAGGALSSVFGNGRVDPENANWNGYTQAYDKTGKLGQQQGATPQQITNAQQNLSEQVQNPYGALAGYFDLRNNQVKGNNPMYQQYGRKGEQQFTNDMLSQINNAAKSGTITNQDDASQIYNKVVQPWENSWGKGASTDSNSAAMQGLLTQMISQYAGGQAQKDWTGSGGQQAFSNLGKLSFAPTTPSVGTPATQAAPTPTITPQNTGITNMRRPVMARGGVLKKHFDDGGYTGDSGSDFSSQPSYDPGAAIDFNSLYAGNSGNDTTNTSNMFGGNFDQQFAQDQLTNNNLGFGIDALDQQYGIGAGAAGSSKPGALASLAKNATGGAGLSGLLKTYGPLIPLIAGAVNSNKTKTPTLPAGMSNSAPTSLPAPHFNRSPIASPSNKPGGAPMSQQDWYTYGQRPAANFFQNNQVPLVGSGSTTGVPGPMPVMARGGAAPPPLRDAGALGQATGVPEFNSAAQSHVPDEGPGDGTSDDVDAKLSKGEYVMDANTVSMAGNGSNSAGAKALDALRQKLRQHAAQPMAKGQQFMKAKPLHQYLPAGHPARRGAK